jgi:hypothetical protein
MKITADAEELAQLEGLPDAELVKLVRDGFKQFRAGGQDAETLQGNVASSKPIEPTDRPGEDDPPPTTGTPRPPERPGGSLAAGANDRASLVPADMRPTQPSVPLAADAFRAPANGQALGLYEHEMRVRGLNESQILNARRVDPRSAAVLARLIPGVDRLP